MIGYAYGTHGIDWVLLLLAVILIVVALVDFRR